MEKPYSTRSDDYMNNIGKLLESIKRDPFLKYMFTDIKQLVNEIIDDSITLNKKSFYICLSGVAGSGKTNFIYEYLSPIFKLLGNVSQDSSIHKIASHNVSLSNKNKPLDQVIVELIARSDKDIILFDDFNSNCSNTDKIAITIKQLNTDNKNHIVFLSSALFGNKSFIEDFYLQDIFLRKYHLLFFKPSAEQLVDIFVEYAKLNGNFVVTNEAFNKLLHYFITIKRIKDFKDKIHREGKGRFPAVERRFVYGSEIFPLFKEILMSTNTEFNVINDRMVESAGLYKQMLNDKGLI